MIWLVVLFFAVAFLPRNDECTAEVPLYPFPNRDKVTLNDTNLAPDISNANIAVHEQLKALIHIGPHKTGKGKSYSVT